MKDRSSTSRYNVALSRIHDGEGHARVDVKFLGRAANSPFSHPTCCWSHLMKPRRRVSKQMGEELIERLAKADRSVTELAGDLNVSPAALAEWILEPSNAALLCGLA